MINFVEVDSFTLNRNIEAKMPQFTHLHVHTHYSILDGASPIEKLIERTKELGMPAIAITDHGNMFGVKKFHQVATEHGVKPIIGCEVYVVKDRFEQDKDERAGDHLILLAKNLVGYHNLVKIVSYAWTEGFYYRPRIDKSLLKKYGEGLICSTACLGGELPQAIMHGRTEDADRVIEEFKELFGDDFYLEMQLHRSGDPVRDRDVYENQLKVNKRIVELAERHSVKYIASNDVHFVLEEDAEAHDRLICLNTGRDLDDPNRMRYSFQEYLKSPEQMAELFSAYPEALKNTIEIASKIEEYSLDHKPLMPEFPIPEDFKIDETELKKALAKQIKSEEDRASLEQSSSISEFIATFTEYNEALKIAEQFRYLKHITYEGAKKRYCNEQTPELTQEIIDRIEFELETIEWMGYPGYFLIIWDLIKAARRMGVAVGPGRGSAAGSAVAYSLWITNIDPIKYDLLFERFLNPERISLPDIDIDFDDDGRTEVLKYVIGKYGEKRVAQIVTFGTMAPKMAIRDVARVQKLPLHESDRLAKLVPDRIEPKKGESVFDRVYKDSPELSRERQSSNPLIKETLKYAEKLEGTIRQTGVHACGVIIGSDDLENFVPIATAKDADLNVVQYEGTLVESVGLIKMDFLGLRTLSIIKDAVDNVEQSTGKRIDIDTIPLDDKLTYELYSRGDTTGLFQFESAGMKKHLRNLKPNRFEDLIAMNALYRPGPMEYIPKFIDRKHGREEVTYDLDVMEEHLSDTYGITVYQEQVMLLSQKLANFTGGEADTLRKAMGKKVKSELDKLKPKFDKGVQENGHSLTITNKIWSDWEAFADYAFNKSHSTCYAYLSYQTGYLKAHYPSEFMAALLSRNLSDIKKLGFFMDECKRMGLEVLGPDVNLSIDRFAADSKANIRFGLAGIKGIGTAAVISLIEERKENGEFKSIYDLVERVNLQVLNKRNLENLAQAGAFDNIVNFERSAFFAPMESGYGEATFIEVLIRYGSRVQEEKNNMQQSLFGESSESSAIQRPEPNREYEWNKLEKLTREREVIGMYLSSHPLDDYKVLINALCNVSLAELEDFEALRGRDFTVAGMVTDVKNMYDKNGRPFGRFTLEDYNGSFQFTLWDKEYENFRPFLYSDYYLLIRGKIEPMSRYRPELMPRISSMMQLSEAQKTMINELTVTIPINEINDQVVEQLYKMVGKSKGDIALRIRVVDPQSDVSLNMLSSKHRVNLNPELVDFCNDNDFRYTLT